MAEKTIDFQKLFEVPEELITGFESGDKSDDDVKEWFHGMYIAKSLATEDEDIRKTVMGSMLGTLETNAKKAFGFSSSDVKDKKLSEIFEMAAEKHTKALGEKDTEIAGLSTGDADSEKTIKELKEKMTLKEEALTAKDEELHTANSSMEELKSGHAKEIKSTKIDSMFTHAFGGINFKDDLSEIERSGLKATLNQNFTYELSDEGDILVLDSKGEKVSNDKKTEFVSLSEHLETQAREHKLLKMNTAPPEKKVPVITGKNGEETSEAPKRTLHPAAIKRAEQAGT